MIGNNNFDWTVLDDLLDGSASRSMHASFAFYIQWPGRPLNLPDHLIDVVPMFNTTDGPTPDYNHPVMLEAYAQFITALGARYDADRRIAFVHVGLLGFWGKWRIFRLRFMIWAVSANLSHSASLSTLNSLGEFHCFPDFCVERSTTAYVVNKFMENFHTTQIQVRYPEDAVSGTGLYDASFAYTTLDGDANGGVAVGWFYWPYGC